MGTPRRRWRWVLVATLAWALLAGGALWWLRLKPGVTLAAYNQIREGMTGVEVEAVFGQPFDTESDGGLESPEVKRRFWYGEHWVINVGFDENERVVRKEFYDLRDENDQSFFQQLGKWLGL